MEAGPFNFSRDDCAARLHERHLSTLTRFDTTSSKRISGMTGSPALHSFRDVTGFFRHRRFGVGE